MLKVLFKSIDNLRIMNYLFNTFIKKHKIIDAKINNSYSLKFLKNPFKKIKNSSQIATLNYLFFEILIGKNPIDIIETKSSSTIGKPVFGNSILVKDCGCVKFSNFEIIDF